MDFSFALQITGAFCGLLGQHFVNQRKVTGFYLWLVSNAALIDFQMIHTYYVLALLHSAYFLMACQGIYLWRKEAKLLVAVVD